MNRKKGRQIAQIILRVTLIVVALIQIKYELNWLHVYITRTCELFQAPTPNYGDLMASHHVMRLLISVIAIVLAVKKETILHIEIGTYKICIKRFGILFLLMFQFILLTVEAVYGERYMYTFGHNTHIMLSILQPLPLFLALLLLLFNMISEKIAVCFTLLDLLLYVLIEWKNRDSFSLYYPHYDIYSRIIFCLIMILLIILSQRMGKKETLESISVGEREK